VGRRRAEHTQRVLEGCIVRPSFSLPNPGPVASWLLRDPDLPLPWPALPPDENHTRLVAQDDGVSQRHWFPNWGPTTDIVRGLIFRRGPEMVFTFEFWRPTHHIAADMGRVFVAVFPER
jgi:hypothetical protein